jgi:hypothetical protein
VRGKGTKLGEGDYYVVSGILRSVLLRSGLFRSGKVRGAAYCEKS